MTKEIASEKLTEEILNHLRPILNAKIKMAIGVGVDLGRIECMDNQKIRKCKPVQQLTKEGKVIKTWESITAAEKALGISTGNITGCLNTKLLNKPRRHTAGGFKWKYMDKEDRVKNKTNQFWIKNL